MDSDSAQAQVQEQMRVFSSDGKLIGKVWHVFTRETETRETYVEVHPLSFWQGILDGFSPQYATAGRGHLYFPAGVIKQVRGKRVSLGLKHKEAAACTQRPPWLAHDKEIMPLQIF
jgi:hypothetical protein